MAYAQYRRVPEVDLPDNLLVMLAMRGPWNELTPDVLCEAAESERVDPPKQWPTYNGEDPFYWDQTNLQYLGLGDIWKETRGKFADGSKVKVAIIDSGIDVDHPDFYDENGRSIISERSYNANTDITVAKGGIQVIDDTYGHGTNVAGVIAAQMNKVGVVGIAPDVELLVVKISVNADNKYSGADIALGLDHAIAEGVHVINMSFGAVRDTNAYGKQCGEAVAKGIIMVASAGNNADAQTHYPAADPRVIGVGALEYNSWDLASYSCYGENSDLVAPGGVYTTSIGGTYDRVYGTSFASPTVAAAIALYISKNGVTPYTELRERLLSTCVDLGEQGEDAYFGHGALDIGRFFGAMTLTFDYRMAELGETYAFMTSEGVLIQAPPAPEPQGGLELEGWYLDARLTQKVDFQTHRFTEDTRLYARWLGASEGDFDYYEYARGFVRILAYRGEADTVQIPATLGGKNVSAIAPFAFLGNRALKEVTLPEKLHTVGRDAFEGCEGLRVARIYSADILEQITERASLGGLCKYAGTILADTAAKFDEKEIKQLYPHTDRVEWSGVVYTKYSDHASEWVEGDAIIAYVPCVQDGVLKLGCAVCGCASERLLPKHTAGQWALHTPAGCTTKGTDAVKCVACSTVLQTREIPSTGHSYNEGVTVAPQCEKQGYFLRVCKTCGLENKSKFVGANGHTAGEWVITLNATKTEAGEEQRSCLVCSKTVETRAIAAYTHLTDFEKDVAALTGEGTKASFEAICACLNYYAGLDETERLLVKSDYERLCQMAEGYNENVQKRNEELAQSVKVAPQLLGEVHRALGGLWYAFHQNRRKGA